jgi:hypothetical protein
MMGLSTIVRWSSCLLQQENGIHHDLRPREKLGRSISWQRTDRPEIEITLEWDRAIKQSQL